MAPRVARYRASSLFQNQRRKVVSHGTIPRKPEVSGAPRPRCADWPERVDLNRQSRFVTSPFGTFRTCRPHWALSVLRGQSGLRGRLPHGDRCVEFLRYGVLPDLRAPCRLLVLAGPEHGRTISIAEV